MLVLGIKEKPMPSRDHIHHQSLTYLKSLGFPPSALTGKLSLEKGDATPQVSASLSRPSKTRELQLVCVYINIDFLWLCHTTNERSTNGFRFSDTSPACWELHS